MVKGLGFRELPSVWGLGSECSLIDSSESKKGLEKTPALAISIPETLNSKPMVRASV